MCTFSVRFQFVWCELTEEYTVAETPLSAILVTDEVNRCTTTHIVYRLNHPPTASALKLGGRYTSPQTKTDRLSLHGCCPAAVGGSRLTSPSVVSTPCVQISPGCTGFQILKSLKCLLMLFVFWHPRHHILGCVLPAYLIQNPQKLTFLESLRNRRKWEIKLLFTDFTVNNN